MRNPQINSCETNIATCITVMRIFIFKALNTQSAVYFETFSSLLETAKNRFNRKNPRTRNSTKAIFEVFEENSPVLR